LAGENRQGSKLDAARPGRVAGAPGPAGLRRRGDLHRQDGAGQAGRDRDDAQPRAAQGDLALEHQGLRPARRHPADAVHPAANAEALASRLLQGHRRLPCRVHRFDRPLRGLEHRTPARATALVGDLPCPRLRRAQRRRPRRMQAASHRLDCET